MHSERLLDALSAIRPLSDGFRIALEKELVRLSLPARHFLLEAPDIADHVHFLETGFAMSYTFFKGKKQVEDLWMPGQIVLSVKSFFEQVPSTEFIQLMEQSDVLYISYASVSKLFDVFPEANAIYRVTMNRCYDHGRARIRDLQHLTSVQRYLKLQNTYPRIEQIIPQEYIASYLGIAPQSLSRMKKNI